MMLLLLPLALFASAFAETPAISGQSYLTFSRYYQANVDFINKNDNRHLLPLVIANRGNASGDGRFTYELIGDTLALSILTDPSDTVIERCTITLTAPSGMEYGNALYNDFAISGYHSYALLMAMHADPDPVRRYQLVTEVVEGLALGGGEYSQQLGVYTLTCTRGGNTAVLDFLNNRIVP